MVVRSRFLVFIGGLAVVTTDAVKHARKPLHDEPIKPTCVFRSNPITDSGAN